MSLVIPSGSITLMKMDTPPPGWTKLATNHLHALRVVTGATSSGGSVNYTSVFTTFSASTTGSSFNIDGTSTSLTQLPTHLHGYNIAQTVTAMSTVGPSFATALIPPSIANTPAPSSPNSGTDAHSHPSTASISSISGSLDMRVKYVDSVLVQRS